MAGGRPAKFSRDRIKGATPPPFDRGPAAPQKRTCLRGSACQRQHPSPHSAFPGAFRYPPRHRSRHTAPGVWGCFRMRQHRRQHVVRISIKQPDAFEILHGRPDRPQTHRGGWQQQASALVRIGRKRRRAQSASGRNGKPLASPKGFTDDLPPFGLRLCRFRKYLARPTLRPKSDLTRLSFGS